MKVLLSINKKFFRLYPKELISVINTVDFYKEIDGIELSFDDNEYKYAEKIAKLCLREKLILNIHAPVYDLAEKYYGFFDEINKIVKIYDNRFINVTFHPINNDEQLTIEILRKIVDYNKKHNYDKTIICLENLTTFETKRVEDILRTENDICFTYDIGHEFVNGIVTENLSKILNERVRDINVHTHIGKVDHCPIKDFTDEEKNVLNKVKIINEYQSTVVAEYSIDYCNGKTFEKELRSYIEDTIKLKRYLENK